MNLHPSRIDVIANELAMIPVVTAYNAISRFIELRRRDNDNPVDRVVSINFETGEIGIAQHDGAGNLIIEDGRHVVENMVIDLNLYYIAFKTPKRGVKKHGPTTR